MMSEFVKLKSIQHPSTRNQRSAFRITIVRDVDLDADARCACRLIANLPGVDAEIVTLHESSAPILLREAAKLFRHRNEIDLLVTAGKNAATLGKLGADRWLDIGTTDHRGHVRPARVGLALEAFAPTGDRTNVRALLGIDERERVIYAPGRVTYQSHFTAFHAASILNFSDSRYRLLVEPADQLDWLESMAAKMEQPKLVVSRRHDLTEAEMAHAADIVLAAPGANAARVPVARTIALKIPIVVAHNRYTQWLDEIVDRIDPPKPRLLVKAMMRVFENPLDEIELGHKARWIRDQFNTDRAQLAWTDVLARACRRAVQTEAN